MFDATIGEEQTKLANCKLSTFMGLNRFNFGRELKFDMIFKG